MYVAAIYTYNDDTATRDELRPAHRDFLGAHPALLLSGPTGTGAVIIFEDESAEKVETWLNDDPFWKAGVIAERVVTPWTIGMGTWKPVLGLQ